MSQSSQTPSDNTQYLQNGFPQIHQSVFPATNDLSPASNLQRPVIDRPSRLQQAKNDLISDLNIQRKTRPATSRNSRPFAIAVAAIATAVSGIACLLGVLACLFYLGELAILFGLFYSPSPSSSPSSTGTQSFFSNLPVFSQDLLIVAVFYLTFIGITQLYLARGLWQSKYGSYWGIMGLEGLVILVQFLLLILFHNGGFFFSNVYVAVLIVAFATYGFHERQPYQLSAAYRKTKHWRMLFIVGFIIILTAIVTTSVFATKPSFLFPQKSADVTSFPTAPSIPTSVPTPTSTPEATSTPTGTINSPGFDTPEALIDDFCQKLMFQDYGSAYNEYSRGLQSQVSFTDFKNYWSANNKQFYHIDRCDHQTIPTPAGTSVTAAWSTHEFFSGQVQNYSITYVIQDNDGWKVEKVA